MRRKILIGGLIIVSATLMVSCTENDNKTEEPNNGTIENPEDKEDAVMDLGVEELANCYIVQSPGKYRFEATNRFNLGAGKPVPPTISPVSASLVWQTTKGSISSVELITEGNRNYVEFNVSEARGNAVLAVYDATDEIAWSWHIWMPEEDVKGIPAASGYEVMNMNLGAMHNRTNDAGSYGLLYQWGRKDPFPAAETLTGTTATVGAAMYDLQGNSVSIQNSEWTSVENNTIAYSISHPTVCLSNYYQFSTSRDWLEASLSDNALWGNPEGYVRDEATNQFINSGSKTCYDPSPAGWRVGPVDTFRHFTTSGGYVWDFSDFNIHDVNGDSMLSLEDYNYGWHFYINASEPMYFPAAARYDGSYGMLMGSMSGLWGNYWSNSPHADMAGGAVASLSFQIKDMYGNDMISVSPYGGGSRADAYSVRCVRDYK